MLLTGSEILLQELIKHGVTVLFGYPGGAIMPVYDALSFIEDKIHHVLVRHEQGAVHAAEGFARATNTVGVCMVTSGPGATNLITGIADAMLDSVPLVCITGQVAEHALGSDAFQESDIIGISVPITKWNFQITSAKEIHLAIDKAFKIAQSGRPGPVLLDITKNAQYEQVEYDPEATLKSYKPRITSILDKESVRQAAQMINEAQRPMILCGHGVKIASAEKELLAVAEQSNMAVAATLHGLSSFPSDHSLYKGFLGMHGNYGPNVLSNEADVVLAVGMRFDDRVTGDLNTYLKNAQIIHIEIDPSELNKNVPCAVALNCDVYEGLKALLPFLKKRQHVNWHTSFDKAMQHEYEMVIHHSIHPSQGPLKMAEFIHLLAEKTQGSAILVTDVGQHQMIAARYYPFKTPRSHITSGGLGTMGFSLPAAIGVKLALPDRLVISISGDGGFQMNMQELAVVIQEQINLKIVILNNEYLGMVRQWQELFFDRRYSFTNLVNPDFTKIAAAYGISALKVDKRELLSSAIDALLEAKTSFLLEVMVEKEENVFPMVPSGTSIDKVRIK